jgi:hypothetical protein
MMPQTSVTQKLFDSKYDNQTWEVVKYESGTVIVTTRKKELAHFYVYGPKIDPEDARDALRYQYAEEFALFLNTGTRPVWLNHGMFDIMPTTSQLVWKDGASVAAYPSHLHEHEEQKSEINELFTWLIDSLAVSYQVDAILEQQDKFILDKMRLFAQEYTPEKLTQLRNEIDSHTVLGEPSTVKIINSLGDVIAEAPIGNVLEKLVNSVSKITQQMKAPAQPNMSVHLSTPEDFLKAEHHMLGAALDMAQEDLKRMTFVLRAIREHGNRTSEHAQEMQMAAAWALEPKKWPKPKWLKETPNA